jgi:hypothetical protein
MTVTFDEDLLAPMLAGWQKVAYRYGLRAYVFRRGGKIFAVTNKEQGLGELVTIIEPTLRPKEPTSAAAPPTGPIAGRVRTARPPRAPYASPELRSKRARPLEEMEMARRDDQDLYHVSDAKPRLPADLRRPRPKRSASASRSQLEQRRADVGLYGQSGTEPTLDEVLGEPAIRLIMKRDNVTEDQLLHLINTACRHPQIEQHRT